MSVLELFGAARDLGRLQEIAGALVRHGFGDLVGRMKLAGPLERAGRALRLVQEGDLAPVDPPVRVRRAMEDLGPTFVKLGQVLATRPDILPPEWIAELSKLQEHVATVPFAELEPTLLADLGEDWRDAFERFDEEPLAAGSLGQVHRARLVGGDEVVVKIRRPGVRDRVRADLRILERLAEIAEGELEELHRYRPARLVRSLSRVLRDELDFALEGRSTKALAAAQGPESNVVFPRVFEDFTSERVLVMEYLRGVSAASWIATGEPDDLDRQRLAECGCDTILGMVFEHGTFHADPHPGNVLFLDPLPPARLRDRIGLIDCGMVGHLSEERRREFTELLLHSFSRDERRVVQILLRWAGDEEDVDEDQLATDARAFIDRYHDAKLDEIEVSGLLGDVLTIVRQNALQLPPDVTTLIRVFVLTEALGRALDPDFQMASRIQPFLERQVASRLSPLRLFLQFTRESTELARDLPHDLRAILDRARRGRLKLGIDMRRLDAIADQLESSINRLVVGIVTAALIVGAAIAMTVQGGPTLLGLPLFGFLGFLSSLVLGFGLLISIWRSGR